MISPLIKPRYVNPALVSKQLAFKYFHQSTISLLFKKPVPSPTPIDPSTHPILKRVPKFLLPYTKNFINAPISHVTSFLILHELTAIIPLVGFWYLFHKYDWLVPMDLPTWAIEKGTKVIDKSMDAFDFSGYSINEKAKFIMEGAYSYVLVKSLFPVRVLVSLGLMPTFAKYFVIPITSIFSKKNKKVSNNVKGEVDHENTFKLKKINKPRL